MMNAVRLRALDTVKRIVLERLAGHPASVYLFGSGARGDVGHWNDIEDDLEESTVPYFVDAVNLAASRPDFRQEVEREGIEWTR